MGIASIPIRSHTTHNQWVRRGDIENTGANAYRLEWVEQVGKES